MTSQSSRISREELLRWDGVAIQARKPDEMTRHPQSFEVTEEPLTNEMDHIMSWLSPMFLRNYGTDYLAPEYRSEEGIEAARKIIRDDFQSLFISLRHARAGEAATLPDKQEAFQIFEAAYNVFDADHEGIAHYREVLRQAADALGLGDIAPLHATRAQQSKHNKNGRDMS